ncbi:MAG: type II toxin-antitoxin system VapC family toxin [Synergistaceae bacterium]|nr:type II toxin-antitoxin system VapC family toxin [Synergistaceae bacterium]
MKNVYYLDSNICIFYLRNPEGVLAQKIISIDPECIKLSAIVKAELLVGAFKSARRDENLKQVLNFCDSFEIVPFDDSLTVTYGKMQARLELQGMKIGFNDTLIAATVLAHNGILVTNNTKEFSRVDGLTLEDWTQE